MQKSVYEYVSKKLNDPIVERKVCTITGTEFPIYKSDLEFYDKISPVINGKKYQLPTPTICPEERQRKRLMFRNERKIYRRKCDFSGKDIISIYSPDKPYKAYDQKIWRSDQRDPMQYGRDFDFKKTFNEQFDLLIKEVPHCAVYNPEAENCDYANICLGSKNCYLTFVGSWSENVHFSHRSINGKNSMDLYRCAYCENSYQINGGIKAINSTFSFDLDSCNNCHYCINLIGCSDCFLCYNLVNKSYCVENIKYTKEEYFSKIKEYTSNISNKYTDNFKKYIKSSTKNYGGENIIGNGNFYGKNLIFCSNMDEGSDSKYFDEAGNGMVSNIDCNYGGQSTLCYETVSPVGAYSSIATFFTRDTKYCLYSYFCFNCKNCFGCVGLRDKEYCIFNKQYTKSDYETMIQKTIEHMQTTGERGEFFNSKLATFAYNETIANEYFPLTKEEALKRGYKRQDNNYDPIIPKGAETLQGDQIPLDISTVTDDILSKILICEISNRPFKLIKQELDFYRKHNLPLPRKHPDIRHEERVKMRPGRELHLRTCDKCGIDMISIYPKNHQGEIYCEACYQKEIYG